MNAITPLDITADTVTLARADYDALLTELEEARDIATVRQFNADLAADRTETLPWEMARTLLDGANPVRVWREHRGMTARALAAAAGIAPGYLSEIETGKKPGSAAALKALATVLRVDMEDLVPDSAPTADTAG
ncbi:MULTISPECIES: helix-turn-helix domain-containing protein [unclassified Azospirillum]|uniref:helix-turn-helix domain-containing protein n=1 Tax=unclassified Azospirillum TaxID=2630922 RepID=UPI000B7382D1|nr:MULTISPECIES: helix-turn-helix transcriptional regulator [unclassified Azospirillum]SNS24859.1 Helix-turn-helix domain-containing protein [Azospirillum sp. RU38E]SNS43331.1 Helix-turn-helix domain-containing protein [Azospirillum sp. RU37A]